MSSFTGLFIFSLCFIAYGQDCQHTNNSFRCVKYIKNYDGDTITVNIPKTHSLLGNKISVRVRGVDTPEIRTKDPCEKNLGRNARRLVESLLKKAERIDLENVERGKYFRIVADVVFDGRNLKEVLLEQKLAILYDGKKKQAVNWCELERLPASE